MNKQEIDLEIKKIQEENKNIVDIDYFLCKLALTKYYKDIEISRYITSFASGLTDTERKFLRGNN